jgi:hypothetical protein
MSGDGLKHSGDLRPGMKKISNEHNELERTHAARVRFSLYQFVAFFIFIYDPGVHSRLCGE